MKSSKNFGQLYKQWRERKGVSNYHVEKMTGYSRSNLSNMESGKIPPSDDLLQKLASVPELELTIDELQAWKALDQFGPETISAASKQLPLDKQEELVRDIVSTHPERGKLLMDIFDQPVSISCPNCGHNLRVTLSSFLNESNVEVQCPVCGTFTIINNKAKAGLEAAEEALSTFSTAIESLNKAE